MSPQRLSTPLKLVKIMSLSPTLTIVPELLELGGGSERTVEFSKDEVYLVAAGER